MLPENEFSSFIKKCFYPDPDAKGYYFCIDNQQTKRIILYAPLNWLSIEILWIELEPICIHSPLDALIGNGGR